MSMELLALCTTPGCLSFALPGHEACRHCEARWFLFDPAATTEAAAYMLKQAGGQMEMGKLMSMLYLADVTMLREHGRLITGAQWYATQEGVWSPEIAALMGETAPPAPATSPESRP